MGAGFKPNLLQARSPGFSDEPVKYCICDAAAAPLAPNIHPFDFAEFRADGNATTADRVVVVARHKKPDVGVEYRIKPQSVALIGRVKRAQFLIEFLDQPANIGGCR